MKTVDVDSLLIPRPWEGQVSGCMLGKLLEILSFQQGREGIETYFKEAGSWLLRNYVPLRENSIVEKTAKACCLDHMVRAEADDDNVVGGGWDADCNGATVGGLFGLTGAPIPDSWVSPWNGRVAVSLAGFSEFSLEELVSRTVSVTQNLNVRLAA